MLSQTVEYALRAMVHLAAHGDSQGANSEEIARKTRVPKGYLSKIMRDLVVADLVISRRGPGGGFVLARPASSVSILDVISAVDPITRIRDCPLGDPTHKELCPLHRRLDDAIGLIEQEFRRTTLAEVLASTGKKGHRCSALIGPTISAKRSR